MDNDTIKKEIFRIRIRRVKIAVVVIILAIIVAIPTFFYIRITTEARLALREAKNSKLAIKMLDIEYYGMGQSVYDANKRNGLANGVLEAVQRINGNEEGEIAIVSYDIKNREVMALSYTNKNYEVIFTQDINGKEKWTVNYLVHVLDYSD